MNEVKKCRFCGEEILDVAIKCKHCGSNLDGMNDDSNMETSKTDYEMILLALPVIGTFLVIFWVGSMNLLQGPSNSLALILVSVVLGTAIIAAMEANKVGMKSDKKKGTATGTTWFFFIVLLWFVGYPWYLLKRKHYGLANRFVAGLIVMLIFLGSYGSMSVAIESQRTSVLELFE